MLKLVKTLYKTTTKTVTTISKAADYGTGVVNNYIDDSITIDKDLRTFRTAMRKFEELVEYRDEVETSTDISDSMKKKMLEQIDAKLALLENEWAAVE